MTNSEGIDCYYFFIKSRPNNQPINKTPQNHHHQTSDYKW